MSLKRIDFENAPSGAVDNHQRFILGVGLDPLPTNIMIKANGHILVNGSGHILVV